MGTIPDWLSKLWARMLQDYQVRFDVRESARFLRQFIDSLLILLAAWVLIWITKALIRRFERRIDRIHGADHRRRVDTILSLLVSALKYTIYFTCTFWILSTWGINTESLLVGTAVVGAAIGFGSQGLVQDVITGLSMLAEDQLSVGDFVEIAGKSGAVEEVGLRVVKIRDAAGVQHVIFNRTINMVSNFTAGAVQAWVDISLESAQDSDKAVSAAEKICRDMADELPNFPRAPKVVGLRSSSTGEFYLRIDAVVLPNQDAVLSTHFADRIKSAFAAQGIKIPNDRIRVAISSELFRQAMQRGKRSGKFPAPQGKPAGDALV